MDKKIDFLFVGPQRTGTTWIYEQLINHNELCFPKDVKETMFFDQHFEEGYDWYFWHFRHKKKGQLLGEVAPTYFDDDKAANRIHRLNPDCKIFISLRNPVKRARSIFHHHLRKGRVGNDFSSAKVAIPQIITAGKYSVHIPRWINLFGKEKVHIIFLEDVKTSPDKVLKFIADMLGVHTVFDGPEKGKEINAATMPKNMFFAKYGAKLAAFLRSKRLHKLVEAGKKMGLKTVFSGNKNELTNLSRSEKKMLLNTYEKDILFVEKLTTRDLTHWRTI